VWVRYWPKQANREMTPRWRSPSEHCRGTSWTYEKSVFCVLPQFCLQIHTVGCVLPATSSPTSFLQIRFLSFAIFIIIITVFPSSPSCFQLFSFCFQKAGTSNRRTEYAGTLHLLTFHYFQKIRKGQTVAGEKWFLFLLIDLQDNWRNGNCIIYRSYHSNVSQNWSLKKTLHVKAWRHGSLILETFPFLWRAVSTALWQGGREEQFHETEELVLCMKLLSKRWDKFTTSNLFFF